jgi:outer membrane receptor protein involved in Fe transport
MQRAKRCNFKAIFSVLAFLAAFLAATNLSAQAQVTLTVQDSRGAAVAGAQIADASGRVLAHSDSQGLAVFSCSTPCRVRISANGFEPQTATAGSAATVILLPASTVEQITVSAYREPLSALDSPTTTRLLTQTALQDSPGVTLDEKMRQIPGVETFRRSSSLVANPTSQGISLRGLGSTSASRTLVTDDDMPLNDPLGGWIDWNETPELAIRDVEVVRGGASDLYGSSAIGGVINVMPIVPTTNALEVNSSYGSEATVDESILGQVKHGPWGLLGAGGIIGTDGYTQEAPSQRGPVDQRSNVHSQNGMLEGDRDQGPLRLFLRGIAFNELRHNGTPYQFNRTDHIRYATGANWKATQNGTLAVRLYGSDERYRQTFSSLLNTPNPLNPTCTFRCSESASKFSFVPVNELGAAAHWSQPMGAGFLLLAGADVHDVRVWDGEQALTGTSALTKTNDHQRDSGMYGQAMWIHRGWTLTAAGRVDWFQNFDGVQLVSSVSAPKPVITQVPRYTQTLFDPRLGVDRKLGEHWALAASGFRAFRAPTPSELYRSTQVGAQLTLPNNDLLNERATGWEAGLVSQRHWGTVRASYFLTQVNRPIAALFLSTNKYMRENLGQIESRGISLDYELEPRSWLVVDGGYQYAHAVVSRGTQATGSTDLGNWIPEVARNMATLNIRAFRPRLGTLSIQNRISGRMFDDDANTFLLHGYYRMDTYASHNFGSRFTLYAAGNNLFDRQIQVSETPTTTLADGRTGRVGFTIQLGRLAR